MGQKQCDLRYGIPGHTAYALQDFPPFTYTPHPTLREAATASTPLTPYPLLRLRHSPTQLQVEPEIPEGDYSDRD
jgi:hypothetical protein